MTFIINDMISQTTVGTTSFWDDPDTFGMYVLVPTMLIGIVFFIKSHLKGGDKT